MDLRKFVAKILTVLLFGTLIMSFAVWGIGDMFRGGSGGRAVVQVGDTIIDPRDLAYELRREVRRLSNQFGAQIDSEQLRLLGIDRLVLRNLIGRALLGEIARREGMVISKAAVQQAIFVEAAFHDEFGYFDEARFRSTLSNAGLSEAAYVERLRHDMTSGQLTTVVTGAAATPDALTRRLFAYEGEKRIAQYIRVPAADVASLPEPGESALVDYYNGTKGSYLAPENRAITLVELIPDQLAGEIGVSEEAILEEFEARRQEFDKAELRTIEQIVLADEDTAQSTYQRIANGEDFFTVAEEVTGQGPVSLGESDGDGLLPEIRTAAFAAPIDRVGEPVKSLLGWHLLRVTAIVPGEEATLEAFREQLTRDISRRGAVDAAVTLANELDDQLGAGAGLEAAASAIGLPTRRIGALDRRARGRDGAAVATSVPVNLLVDLAFSTPLGETSLLNETGDGGYFVIRVDGLEAAKERPLDEVRDAVTKAWKRSERDKATLARADALLERHRAGESLEDLASESGLTLESSQPLTRNQRDASAAPSADFAPQLFVLEQDEAVTVPVQGDVLLTKLIAIVAADAEADAAALDQVRASLARSLKADLFDLYMAALEADVGVSINTTLVNEVLNAY